MLSFFLLISALLRLLVPACRAVFATSSGSFFAGSMLINILTPFNICELLLPGSWLRWLPACLPAFSPACLLSCRLPANQICHKTVQSAAWPSRASPPTLVAILCCLLACLPLLD